MSRNVARSIVLLCLLVVSGAVQVSESTREEEIHKSVFPLSGRTAAGLVLAACLIMIAAGGGIGGGGVLVPTYIFVLGFSPHVAIPLSNVTILGSSLTNCILNYQKRHPLTDRPLIDWDIMLVMEPVTIAGAVVGSFVNVISPPWLLCVLLVTLLTMTTVRTLKKGIKMYKKESLAREAELADEAEDQPYAALPPARLSVNVTTGQDFSEVVEAQSSTLLEKSENPALAELLEIESHHSVPKIATMLLVTFGTLGLTILKGGEGVNPLNITCGSWQYWAVATAVLPFVLLVSYFARRHLVERFRLKERLDYEYVQGDVEWNERHTIVYPAICSIAGLCAGLFGIGGGIVKGPLMLEMGVLPQVASATSATMILFTSSAATVSYLLFNSLNLSFGSVLFPVGFVFTLLGQKALNHLVKKYNRASLIILCIAAVIGASSIAMGVESGGSLIHLFQGKADPPAALCG